MSRLSKATTQKIKKLIELGWEIEEDGDGNYLMFIPPDKKRPYYEMREAFKVQFGEDYMLDEMVPISVLEALNDRYHERIQIGLDVSWRDFIRDLDEIIQTYKE